MNKDKQINDLKTQLEQSNLEKENTLTYCSKRIITIVKEKVELQLQIKELEEKLAICKCN